MKNDPRKNRKKLIAFRLHEKEYAYLRRESDERNMKISPYIRMVLFASYVPTANKRLTAV